MKIEKIEFIYADLPLVRPFQTSFRTQMLELAGQNAWQWPSRFTQVNI
jgi:hypothetical protein